jgi:hypothetical protein
MEDLDTVLIRHPDIPGDPIVQPREAFEHHWVRSGWVLAEPPPDVPDEQTEAPATAGASDLPDKTDDPGDDTEKAEPKRRRSTPKEGAE